jgi:hypothetical protein
MCRSDKRTVLAWGLVLLLLCCVAGCTSTSWYQTREGRTVACDPDYGFNPTCWRWHPWPFCEWEPDIRQPEAFGAGPGGGRDLGPAGPAPAPPLERVPPPLAEPSGAK